MASINFNIIFLLSQLLVHQIYGSCIRDNDEIYNICIYDSLSNPLTVPYNNIDNDYDFDYDELFDRNMPLKIVITNSYIPTLNWNYDQNHIIEVLEISGNNISQIFIDDLTSLFRLDLSHNNVNSLNIFELRSLREINLSFNNISDFSLFSLPTNLEYINASYNKIQELLDISYLPRLYTLDLSYNYINHISHMFFNDLNLLEILKISNNNITTLESGIFQYLKSLKHLDLSNNHIELFENSSLSGVDGLKTLDMSYNYINLISTTFLNNLFFLVTLNISNNNITTMQSGIYQNLKSLKYLDISNNYIELLEYSSLSGLDALETLDLSNNYINHISQTFSNELNVLVKLKLSNNNITTLKSGIFQNLKSLNYLDLSHNSINVLEYSCLSGLDLLLTLDLNYNYITSIPGILFYNLKDLTTLNVKGNQLTKLEYEDLLELNRLTTVDFDENLMSCEMISLLLKQFRIRHISVTKSTLHSNTNMHGLNCTRTNESTSKDSFPIELIEKYYTDFKSSRFVNLFNDLESQLNPSIIKDFIAHIMDPYGISNIESTLKNKTKLIEKIEEIVQPNKISVDIIEKLNDTYLDITRNSEKAKDDVINHIKEIKEMFKILFNQRIKILKNILAADEKDLKVEADTKVRLLETMLKFKEISNRNNVLSNDKNNIRESEEISSNNLIYSLLLFLLITVLVIVQISVKIFSYKNNYRIANRKFGLNECEDII